MAELCSTRRSAVSPWAARESGSACRRLGATKKGPSRASVYFKSARLLEGVGDLEDAGFVEVFGEDLHADGQGR